MYDTDPMNLSALIEREHLQWEDPVVERAIFGDARPEVVADAIESFCRQHIGAGIEHARFYRVSVGCVAGLDLTDGRSVVVKAQGARKSNHYLEACCKLRDGVRARGFPCPGTVAGPVRIGDAAFIAETLEENGEMADPHDPEIRKALAACLATFVRLAGDFEDPAAFGGSWFSNVPDDRVFPRPHSPLFDFDKTRLGAEWIDEFAKEAKSRRSRARGRKVLGHYDFRIEHMRFERQLSGEARVTATYDWDSIHYDFEPVLLGVTASNFTADFQREELVQNPTLDEMRTLARDYEEARGSSFDRAERETAAASCVYAMAYRARCAHALSPGKEGIPGDMRPLLREAGPLLLREGL